MAQGYITENLDIQKLSNDVMFCFHSNHGRYASIQATSIFQFQLKILSLLRS